MLTICSVYTATLAYVCTAQMADAYIQPVVTTDQYHTYKPYTIHSLLSTYSKHRISRIQSDRQIYPSYAKIRLMRSEIKRFGTIVREILSEICEIRLMRVRLMRGLL